MKCPFCQCEDTQVKDSRATEEGAAIRRRRVCHGCEARFTTFERVQLRELTVVKGDGSKEPFDREKLFRSFRLCLQKRPVKLEDIDRTVTSIVRELETSGENEVKSRRIGALAMERIAHSTKRRALLLLGAYGLAERDHDAANGLLALLEEDHPARRLLDLPDDELLPASAIGDLGHIRIRKVVQEWLNEKIAKD